MNIIDIDNNSLSVLNILRQALPGLERFIQETLVYESLSDAARLEWALLIQHVTKIQHNKISLTDCFPPPNNSPDQTTQGDSSHLEDVAVSSHSIITRNNINTISTQENNTISPLLNFSYPSCAQFTSSNAVTTTSLSRSIVPNTSISTPVTSSNNFAIFSMPSNDHDTLLANGSIPNTFTSYLSKTEGDTN